MKIIQNHLSPLVAAEVLPKEEQRRLGLLMRRMYDAAGRLERHRSERGPRRLLDEAIALAKRRGDEARNQLAVTSLRFTMYYAKRYLHGPVDLSMEELMSVGAAQLVPAVARWNPEKGSLLTFVAFYLRRAFCRATGRDSYSRKKMRREATFSLNADNGVVAVDPAIDRQRTDHEDEVAERVRFVRGCFPALSERERRIITSRYLEADEQPRTLDEIGGDLGLTRERVRQVEERVLGRLRRHTEQPMLDWAYAGAPIITDRRTASFRFLPESERRAMPVAPVLPPPSPRQTIFDRQKERRHQRYEQALAYRLSRMPAAQ